MEAPAEQSSTLAAPDADQAEAHCPSAEATCCGGDLGQVQQSSVLPAEEVMEPCASSSTPLNMNQGEVSVSPFYSAGSLLGPLLVFWWV